MVLTVPLFLIGWLNVIFVFAFAAGVVSKISRILYKAIYTALTEEKLRGADHANAYDWLLNDSAYDMLFKIGGTAQLIAVPMIILGAGVGALDKDVLGLLLGVTALSGGIAAVFVTALAIFSIVALVIKRMYDYTFGYSDTKERINEKIESDKRWEEH